MIHESKLKDKCTPEIIKKMVELAEGFKMYDSLNRIDFGGFSFPITEEDNEFYFYDTYIFPLLIHRAVEEWNKITRNKYIIITDTFLYTTSNLHQGDERYNYNNYQPQSLTPCEC